ncbi:MAG: RecA bacterial recombination family protein [Labilithrix sp.]|nr:RecA bacterial recombination family protein [Labilithrix sp.]
MAEAAEATRASTGVPGLDAILGGGLVPDSLYIISGRPGAGKTILANQIAFEHVRGGGRVVYATLLAETHAKLIAQMRMLSFCDETRIGGELTYLNALEAVTEQGLPGLLELVRQMVRDKGATLLVLDGMVTAERLASSEAEYKRFISELQTWVGVVGCTVFFVTSNGMGGTISPEHTMVDGIIELSSETFRMRNLRHIAVTKLRGAAFVEGQHSYQITNDGVKVYPRTETTVLADVDMFETGRLTTGVPGLDPLLQGGLVARSTTLLLGASGTGKTVLGMQFLTEGARRGESCLHFGFYEPVDSILSKAARLGFDFARFVDEGSLAVHWQRPAEVRIDALVAVLLKIVRERKVKRLFIDGFVGFRTTHPTERISTVFSIVSDMLIAEGVTTLISDETRELFVREIEIPTQNVSAIFHNIFFFRHVEVGAQLLRLLSIMKTRDSAADRRLWRYEIGDGGVEVVAPFSPDDHHLMLGGPTSQRGAPALAERGARLEAGSRAKPGVTVKAPRGTSDTKKNATTSRSRGKAK